MGTGIIVCGLNGCGKSTLGRALARALGFHFIDSEDLYFPKTNPEYPYASPRSREEAARLLMDEIAAHEDFILAAVRGDYGEAILPLFRYAVLLEVPREIRLARVQERSFQRFGNRMRPGGDLYEREQAFFRAVGLRTEREVEAWTQRLDCPVLRADGTRPIAENVEFICAALTKYIDRQ